MMNPIITAELARAHQEQLRREAASRRGVRGPRRVTVRWPRRSRAAG